MQGFTRRELIVLSIFLVALVAVFLFPALPASDYEWLYWLLVVVPVGWLLATDPERRSSK